MIRMLLPLLLFSNFAFSMQAPWKFRKDTREFCSALVLSALPGGADALSTYRRQNVGEYYWAASILNKQLPVEKRFRPEQVDHLAQQFLLGTIDEFDQAADIFSADMTDGTSIKPEYLDAVYAWMKDLATRPLPTPEEIEARNENRRERGPLNPIEKVLLEKLKVAYAAVVEKIGQPLYGDSEKVLEHYARWAEGYAFAIESWSQIAPGPRDYNIVDAAARVEKIRKYLSDYGSYPSAIRHIDSLVAILDNPDFRKEIEHYTDAPDLFRFKFLHERALAWASGHKSLEETIHTFIADELKKDYGIFVTGGPGGGYIGDLYGFSLYQQLQRSKPWEGKTHEELLAMEQAALDAPVEVRHIGQILIDGKFAEIFAVEMKLGDETLQFAVQARASFADGTVTNLKEVKPWDLTEFKIAEIRPLDRPARIQDGFRTSPIDLREPLLKLVPESVVGAAAPIADYLLVAKVTPTEVEFANQSPTERMIDAASGLGVIILGQTPMPAASIEFRFFDGFNQRGATANRLPMIEQRTGLQVYQHSETKLFTRMTMTMRRNIISGKYELTILRENGAFGIWVTTGKLTAVYQEEI